MKTFVLLTLLLGAGSLQAQSVWRCDSGGRTYGDRPCGEGTAVVVNDDKRSDAEVRAARDVLTRDQALARDLHRQNREAERDALARGSGLAGITAPPSAAPVKPKAPKRKPKKPSTEANEIWRAVALASR